jgi:nitrate reductase alpha subunit
LRAPDLAHVTSITTAALHGLAPRGNNKAFGIDRARNPWSDIPLAEVLLIAGSNCAETFPVLNKFLWQQRDNGGRWIIVDPRETATRAREICIFSLKPGTDVALANGMLHVLIEENLIDQASSIAHERLASDTRTAHAVIRRMSRRRSAAFRRKDLRGCSTVWTRKDRDGDARRGIEHHTTASTTFSLTSISSSRPERSARRVAATERSRPRQRSGRTRAWTKSRSTSRSAFDHES